MRKGKLLFFCLGVGLVLTAVVWAISRDREPTYDGRTLSEWADRSLGGHDDASEAIHHIGTNSFPLILGWLRYQQAPWKGKMLSRLTTARDWLPTPDFLMNWLDLPAISPADRAERVLAVLQDKAEPLAPDLLR